MIWSECILRHQIIFSIRTFYWFVYKVRIFIILDEIIVVELHHFFHHSFRHTIRHSIVLIKVFKFSSSKYSENKTLTFESSVRISSWYVIFLNSKVLLFLFCIATTQNILSNGLLVIVTESWLLSEVKIFQIIFKRFS